MASSDLEEARQLFNDEGLGFPTIPETLAVRLKKLDVWVFSTRLLEASPYFLDDYVKEPELGGEDYAVLSHSGHGANSYAIQYYLVFGSLRIFLHLPWGGVYMNADASSALIRTCFLLADQIVSARMVTPRIEANERLTIVASGFYGSYWSTPKQDRKPQGKGTQRPDEVLLDALRWLQASDGPAD